MICFALNSPNISSDHIARATVTIYYLQDSFLLFINAKADVK